MIGCLWRALATCSKMLSEIRAAGTEPDRDQRERAKLVIVCTHNIISAKIVCFIFNRTATTLEKKKLSVQIFKLKYLMV